MMFNSYISYLVCAYCFLLTLRGALFVYLRYPNLTKSGQGNELDPG